MKISIITASFNSENSIDKTLQSISAQKYKEIEHIVVDGLSTDKSVSIINKSKSVDVLICEQDSGIYDALNKGLNIATGDIICFLHSDDFFSDEFVLQKVASTFIENPSLDVLYGDLQYVSQKNTNKIIRYWKSSNFCFWKLYFGWMPPHPTLFIKKPWYDVIGNFDLKYKISSDYHFITKLFKFHDLNICYLPEVLVNMRTGGESNRSITNLVKKSSEDYNILRDCKFSIPSSLFSLACKNLSKFPQFLFNS